MDKRTSYYKLKLMLEPLQGQTVSWDDLRRLLIMTLGSSEQSVVANLRIMGETGLLKDLGNYKFKVNDKFNS